MALASRLMTFCRRCCKCWEGDEEETPAPSGSLERLHPGDTSMEETYEAVRRRCLSSKTLYEDATFPANSSVLFKAESVPLYGIKWKRPKDISKRPVYIQDNAAYYDMDQGSVGNCWFIAAVGCVAASPQKQILSRVVPSDQGFGSDYCGVFRFYFWSTGKWVEVVIDDRLPTFNGRLIYSSNKRFPDEYWCPLLEKAYAKFNGNYDVLDGGRIHTSLVDLTGGIGEMLPLRDKITDETLTKILINCQNMNSIMGAAIFNKWSIPGEREIKRDTGLYEGHAYAIVKVKEVRTKNGIIILLHMRNPWGWGEWNGAWSDKSPEWNSLSKEDRNSTYKTRDDGEFWISISDFRKHFDELELCHLTPDALTSEIANNLERSQWHITEHYGSWVKGLSAGGPPVSFTSKRFWSNPQFELKVARATGPTTVVISLFEVHTLLQRDTSDISIGFVIFKLQEGKKPKQITVENFYEFSPRLIATSGIYWPYRERTMRYEMEPGEHVIVPCTYKANQESQFYMRVLSEGAIMSSSNKPQGSQETLPMSPIDMSDAVLDRTFDGFAGNAGVIDAAELVEVFKAGLQTVEGKGAGFNLETCRCLVGLLNTSNGLMDKEGVHKIWDDLEIWRKAFKSSDKDSNKLIDAKELQMLFQMTDFHAGPETVEAIMKRYGGKGGLISEEDFLQGFCKALHQYRTFRELEHKRKLNISLNEWMSIAMTT